MDKSEKKTTIIRVDNRTFTVEDLPAGSRPTKLLYVQVLDQPPTMTSLTLEQAAELAAALLPELPHLTQQEIDDVAAENARLESTIDRAWAALKVDPREAADDPDTADLADSIKVSLQHERDERERMAELHRAEKRELLALSLDASERAGRAAGMQDVAELRLSMARTALQIDAPLDHRDDPKWRTIASDAVDSLDALLKGNSRAWAEGKLKALRARGDALFSRTRSVKPTCEGEDEKHPCIAGFVVTSEGGERECGTCGGTGTKPIEPEKST